MKTNPNEPINLNGEGCFKDQNQHTHAGLGLTKREYFSALILQGLCSFSVNSLYYTNNPDRSLMKDRAKAARIQADALIEELNKEQT